MFECYEFKNLLGITNLKLGGFQLVLRGTTLDADVVELAKELVSFSLLYVGFPYNPPDSEKMHSDFINIKTQLLYRNQHIFSKLWHFICIPEELKWFEPPRPPYLSVPLLPPRLEVPPPPPRVLGSVESLNSFFFSRLLFTS